ncbi:MAG: hypothetical protein ACRENG_33695 [bacterium]
MPRWFFIISCCFTLLVTSIVTNSQTQQPAASQQSAGKETVRAIAPPRNPLPPEEASANVTRFSFIVYGDTRGRRDGQAIQYEHSLIVDAMLGTIKNWKRPIILCVSFCNPAMRWLTAAIPSNGTLALWI